tara:strand:- start:239 stop:1765 length:1527 start_codon:yes stop_codon:yes gene_type:complete
MENLITALGLINNYEVFIAICIGSFAGIIFGAIPGLTYSMALALMLPFTFTMQPVTGISLLLATYIGGMTGGSISAILIGIPGTPSAAATVSDGYSLSKKGDASIALGTAVIVSTIGGLISLSLMIVMVDFISKFAIKFGPAEIFMLVLFGFSTICGLAEKSLFRGLVAGLLGLMLMTIGTDEIEGVQRFTFGNVQMLQGVNLLVAMIGLFAVPHILEVFNSRICDEDQKNYDIGVVKTKLPSFALLKKYFNLMLRCVGLGTSIGAIPGSGGPIAAFLAYSHAKNSEKDLKEKELYGKGHLGGVIAPETANNAVTGGAMVPLLSLGIPGDPATAIILGGLLIHGLVPGPMLFIENAPQVYSIYLAILLAYVVVFLFQVNFIKHIVKILRVKPHHLAVGILIMVVVGSYAIRNSFLDVNVMIIMGLIGYFFNRIRLPVTPIVLGLVLGRTIEQEYRTAMSLSAGDPSIFFGSIVCVLFFMLIVLTIALQVRKRVIDVRSQKKLKEVNQV